MFSGLAEVCSGTRSVMSRPKPSSPPYLTGLLVMRRMVVTPRSTSIWAPMPYSRLSTGQALLQVGVDGVVPLLLQLVGADLVAEADAAALVAPQVDEDAPALLLDEIERGLQLGAAVAAQGAEDVAGQALGVDPDEHVLGAGHLAHDERQVLLAVQHRLVDVGPELPACGRDAGLGDQADELLVLAPVADQVGDGDERQVVLLGEALQVGQPGHLGLVLGHDLAQHAGR